MNIKLKQALLITACVLPIGAQPLASGIPTVDLAVLAPSLTDAISTGKQLLEMQKQVEQMIKDSQKLATRIAPKLLKSTEEGRRLLNGIQQAQKQVNRITELSQEYDFKIINTPEGLLKARDKINQINNKIAHILQDANQQSVDFVSNDQNSIGNASSDLDELYQNAKSASGTNGLLEGSQDIAAFQAKQLIEMRMALNNLQALQTAQSLKMEKESEETAQLQNFYAYYDPKEFTANKQRAEEFRRAHRSPLLP